MPRKGRQKGAIGKARRIPASKGSEFLRPVHALFEKHGVPSAARPHNNVLLGEALKFTDWARVEVWVKGLAAALKVPK